MVFICSALLESRVGWRWGAVVWSQRGLCGSQYLSVQHCWRVGGVKVENRNLITAGQDAKHSSLRHLWFILLTFSTLLERRTGWRWGAVAWSHLGKTPIRTNILSFGLCGSHYLYFQHCWRVGCVDGEEPWPLFTDGQNPGQEQHSRLRALWFMVFICSTIGESDGVTVRSCGLCSQLGKETDQDQHSSLRPPWFIIFICSALWESRVGGWWGAVVWSQLGKTSVRANILAFGLCGSQYLSVQHCWRVGWGDGGEPWSDHSRARRRFGPTF